MPNQEPVSAWIFENSSGRFGTQGLFHPYLKTFVPLFSRPDWLPLGLQGWVTHSGIYHSFLSNSQWNSPCLPVFYCVWFCHVMEFVLSSINLTLLVIILTNVNFLLTISIHGQDVRLWELVKWSAKRKCLIFYQILSTYSLRKCVKISLENLYMDIGLKGLIKALLR